MLCGPAADLEWNVKEAQQQRVQADDAWHYPSFPEPLPLGMFREPRVDECLVVFGGVRKEMPMQQGPLRLGLVNEGFRSDYLLEGSVRIAYCPQC